MSFSDIFHEQFPYYLAMGMTYSEYWEQDSSLVINYRYADRLKQQQRSNDAWLQGMYIYEALGVVLGNLFSTRGTQPITYREEPIRVIPKTKYEIQREQIAERQRFVDYLNSLKTNFDKKHKGEQNG